MKTRASFNLTDFMRILLILKCVFFWKKPETLVDKEWITNKIEPQEGGTGKGKE